jgi:hydroxymethylglutaryl-CoA synthase
MCVSYGSGAGSDAFLLTTTDHLRDARGRTKTVKQYLERYQVVHDYADYLRQIDEEGQ